jgi:hypothetical protein
MAVGFGLADHQGVHGNSPSASLASVAHNPTGLAGFPTGQAGLTGNLPNFFFFFFLGLQIMFQIYFYFHKLIKNITKKQCHASRSILAVNISLFLGETLDELENMRKTK